MLYRLTVGAVSRVGAAIEAWVRALQPPVESFAKRFPMERSTGMRQRQRWAAWSVGILVGLGVLGVGGGYAADKDKDKESPIVFQAAGPTVEAIQSTVDAFRAALGDPNNLNNPGPLTSGRREINWDGGGNNDTTIPRSRRSTCSWTAVAPSSPPRGRA
jgi:hypothetical protein